MLKIAVAAVSLATVLNLSGCDSDDNDTAASGPLSEGVNLVMRNTLEEGGPEASFPAQFGAPDNAFDENAIVSFGAVEFPTALQQNGTPVGDIPGLYQIDFTSDQISFTVLPAADDAFWSGIANVFGEFPAGKFDRYYFTFSQPHNITSGSSNNSNVHLRIDSDVLAVVEIGAGYDLQPGVNWTIDLE